MNVIKLSCCVIALALLPGCNDFAANYSGKTYPPTASAVVDVMDGATMLRHEYEGYRVIGSSTFIGTESSQAATEKIARKAAMRIGAEIALLKSEYVGEKPEIREIHTGDETITTQDDKTGKTTTHTIPQYTVETVMVPEYRYRATFLRKTEPAATVSLELP